MENDGISWNLWRSRRMNGVLGLFEWLFLFEAFFEKSECVVFCGLSVSISSMPRPVGALFVIYFLFFMD